MRAFRWARRKIQPGPLILGYHRLAEVEWDPQHLSVRPQHFEEHLEVIGRLVATSTIADVTKSLQIGNASRRAIVITFDDGYTDTLTDALPLLERFGVPASVYISTGLIGQPFWWCEIEHWVKNKATLPSSMAVSLGDYRFGRQQLNESVSEREALLQSLGNYFRKLPGSLHKAALDEVGLQLGSDVLGASGIRAMKSAEIKELSSSNLIDIGSHLVTHTPMDRLDMEEQSRELHESRRVLEGITGGAIESFAYPNSIVSDAAPSLASQIGYRSGVAGWADTVRPGSDPYVLPRVWPGDWDGDQFARWLRHWM